MLATWHCGGHFGSCVPMMPGVVGWCFGPQDRNCGRNAFCSVCLRLQLDRSVLSLRWDGTAGHQLISSRNLRIHPPRQATFWHGAQSLSQGCFFIAVVCFGCKCRRLCWSDWWKVYGLIGVKATWKTSRRLILGITLRYLFAFGDSMDSDSDFCWMAMLGWHC